jgi:hypothetical protein
VIRTQHLSPVQAKSSNNSTCATTKRSRCSRHSSRSSGRPLPFVCLLLQDLVQSCVSTTFWAVQYGYRVAFCTPEPWGNRNIVNRMGGVLPPGTMFFWPLHGQTSMGRGCRERVLFIGTHFSNLYTAVNTPARGRVVVFLVLVCKYVLGHSRVSQPLNLRLCLLRHLGFLTSPYASPTCRRRRLNSYRLLRRFTPDPPSIP